MSRLLRLLRWTDTRLRCAQPIAWGSTDYEYDAALGWGLWLQVRAEHIHRSDLKQGKDVVARGFTEDIYQFRGGVYLGSFDTTAKLQYVLKAAVPARAVKKW